MNTQEAAEKWGVSARTVRGWCKDGWVTSANYNVKTRSWQIAEGALAPLIFSERKREKYFSRLALVLTAFDKKRTIPIEKMHCDRDEILGYINELIDVGYLKKNSLVEDDIFKCYALTIKGAYFLESREGFQRVVNDLAPIISALSEGATKALISRE